MPTVRELKAALDDLGVTYPKKARKALLEQMYATYAHVEGEISYEEAKEKVEATGAKLVLAPGPLYWPDWAERVDRLPPSLQKRHVLKRGVNGGKPPGRPPRGTRWVTGEMPEWLKEL